MRFLNFAQFVHSSYLVLCIQRFCFVPVVLVIISYMVKILSNIILIPIVFLCEISSMYLTPEQSGTETSSSVAILAN